jgi:hypothetical protein
MPSRIENAGTVPFTARARNKEERHGVCGKCKCSWFEEVRVARVDRDKVVAPGQPPPRLTEQFILLRCVRCLELHEPSLVASASPGYRVYTQMLEELDQSVVESNVTPHIPTTEQK